MYQDYAEYVEQEQSKKQEKHLKGTTHDMFYTEFPKYLDQIIKASGLIKEYTHWEAIDHDWAYADQYGKPFTYTVTYKDRMSGIKVKITAESTRITNSIADQFKVKAVKKVL